MTERGISLRALAKTIPCDVGHLSKLSHDKKRPSLAQRIAPRSGSAYIQATAQEGRAWARLGDGSATRGVLHAR